MKRKGIEYIQTRAELRELAESLGVNGWHEPDNQGVAGRVAGVRLDNEGFYGPDLAEHLKQHEEFNIIISQHGKDVAVINIATLLALASELPFTVDQQHQLRTIRRWAGQMVGEDK